MLAAWLAEYQALRAEIEWLINDGTRYQNFAITLLGVIGAAIGWLLKENSVLLLPALLVIPFIYCLLGFLYSRQHEEVFVVAAYLKDYVRPRVRQLVGDDSIWGWEEFKSQRWESTGRSRRWMRSRPFGTNNIVFLLRAMLFVAPSVVALTTALLAIAAIAPFPTLLVDNWLVAASVLFALLFDAVLICLLIRHLFLRGRMPQELFRLSP